MKYCIITNEPDDNFKTQNMAAVGFYQWRNVFGGEILAAREILPSLKDGDFDLIHLRLTPADLPLISAVRTRIGPESTTQVAVSLDYPVEYWKSKFTDLAQVQAAVQQADILFGTEYTICRALERLAGKTVYELPHPADLQKIESYLGQGQGQSQEMILNVLYQPKMADLPLVNFILKLYKIRLRVLLSGRPDPQLIQKFNQRKIEVVVCQNEADFCRAIAEGKAVFAPHSYHNYGKWVIYAAALGNIVVGNSFLDGSRRCYPILSSHHYRFLGSYVRKYHWVLWEHDGTKYLRENARHKVEYYSWANLQDRFLRFLAAETRNKQVIDGPKAWEKDWNRVVFRRDIHYLHGPQRDFRDQRNELTVVCLVKNGMEYLPPFFDHYQRLGVKQFVFIDNGSTDETVDFLKSRPNVTLYQTNLAHKYYENEIRRTIIENLFRGSWVLCVDIDELFDYPGSDQISIPQFLDYLNQHQYTAVIAYMLDMFPKELAFSNSGAGDHWIDNYSYFDISTIKQDKYHQYNPSFHNYNQLSDPTMPYYYGGIRRRYFGKASSKYLLIKHPLMYIDSKIEPVTDPHFCNKAYLADVNCLLKHYKFTNSFKDKLRGLIESYAYFGKTEHEAYDKILKDQAGLDFYSSRAQKLISIHDLVQAGFLKVSKQYGNYLARAREASKLSGNE